MDMPKEIMLRCFPLQAAENKDLTRVSVNSFQMVATWPRVNKTCFLPQRMRFPGLTSNPGSCEGFGLCNVTKENMINVEINNAL